MKQVIKSYTFSTSAKTVTLSDFTTVRLDRLALITDVTTGKILYNFADNTVSSATVATNVITLSALQGGESNSDKLRIDYDVLSSDGVLDGLQLDASGRLLVNPAPLSSAIDSVAVTGAVTDTFATDTTFTITLASLANSTVGVGRQSTLVTNSALYSSALVYVTITVGTSPTANTPIYVYLIRSNNDVTNPVADDGAGASDAGLTVVNAPLLGVLNCANTSSNLAYSGIFDTSLLGPLGPQWGIAVVNSTGVALKSTGQLATYIGITKAL